MCSTTCKKVVKCKKVASKVMEEGVKKAVEGVIVAAILGLSLKMMIAVPAVAFGAGVARVAVGQMMEM